MNKRMMYTMDATIVIMLDPIVPLRLSQRHPKIICERWGVSDACFFRRGCSNHEKDDDGGCCCCCSVSCCSNIVGDVHRYDVAPEPALCRL